MRISNFNSFSFAVRTILLALRDHFTTDDKAAIGYLDYSSESRQELSVKSKYWKCKLCPYDASGRSGKQAEKCDAARSSSITENSTAHLFWIGAILLLLSILTSYTFLYLT